MTNVTGERSVNATFEGLLDRPAGRAGQVLEWAIPHNDGRTANTLRFSEGFLDDIPARNF